MANKNLVVRNSAKMLRGRLLNSIFRPFSRTLSNFEVSKGHDHFKVKKHSKDASVEVTFDWIRDHSRSSSHYNHRTHQRNQSLADVVANSYPVEHHVSNDNLLIKWKDGCESKFALEWIFENFQDVQENNLEFLWRSDQPPDMNALTVEFDDFMNDSKSGLSSGVKSLFQYGFCIVKNSPKTLQATTDVSKRIGPILQTPFGGVWAFSSSQPDSVSDTAYSSNDLGPHNDGTYFNISPGIQVFHCLKEAEKGGETILVDGFQVAEELKLQSPSAYGFFSTMNLEAEYIHMESEPRFHYYNCDKILKHSSKGKLVQFRYNIYDRAPHNLNLDDQRSFYKYLPLMESLVNKPENHIMILLTPGNILLVNNWRVMHGRTMIFGNEREMSGCYISREALESTAKVLGICFNKST